MGEFEGDRLHARGRALALEGGPYWVAYRLETGPRFVTRSLHVSVEGPGHARRELALRRGDDGGGRSTGSRAPNSTAPSIATSGSAR